ncbi:hypothetical protein PROFUN_17052 [Planoprotostelium fungivorum]|uniref:Pre-mRNA-splicing factor SPF27 n=1 Tax=Planoprotostelium fungivorum TaxID=1890364 RepID=A0A2P6MMT5_9EUKA|nr:hypothetical protein PROFUN_17052 [Planoprotostelium fungivorum]
MDILTARYGDTIDALPYIDDDYSAKEDEINEMIAKEQRRFRPEDYLSKYEVIVDPFSSTMVNCEHERIANGMEPETLDVSRYELLPPSESKQNDKEAWERALHNAQSQLEHQSLRLLNLELMNKYGANAYIVYNKYLEDIQKRLQNEVQGMQKQIEDMSLERRNEQVFCGENLRTLESKRVDLIYKNLDLEEICRGLEEEIEALKASKRENGENGTTGNGN